MPTQSLAPRLPRPRPPPPLPLYTIVLLLVTLPIVPTLRLSSHLTPSALAWPVALLLLPFTSSPDLHALSRTWSLARLVESLALAYLVLSALTTYWRVLKAILRDTSSAIREYFKTKKRSDRNLEHKLYRAKDVPLPTAAPNPAVKGPFLTALVIHLVAWRLATAPPQAQPDDWAWPWDLSTVLGVGLGGGVIAAELGRILHLVFRGGRRNIVPRVLHTVFAAHRVMLALRVLGQGIAVPGIIGSSARSTVG